jgi:hypothetical protein
MHGDHYIEAFDQWESMGCPSWGESYHGSKSVFQWGSDPNYYHRSISFESIERETETHYLFSFANNPSLWIPKSICRNLILEKNKVLVHQQTYQNIRAEKSHEVAKMECIQSHKEKMKWIPHN